MKREKAEDALEQANENSKWIIYALIKSLEGIPFKPQIELRFLQRNSTIYFNLMHLTWKERENAIVSSVDYSKSHYNVYQAKYTRQLLFHLLVYKSR